MRYDFPPYACYSSRWIGVMRGLPVKMSKRPLRTALTLALSLLVLAAPLSMPASADSFIPIIDGHTHIYRNLRRAGGEDEAARGALGLMDRLGVTLTILAPPPFPADRSESYGLPELARLVHAHPDRFAFTAGGESLNPMIQETPPGSVTSAVLGRFVEEAELIARSGAAGFGELAAEHFSNRQGRHPYESVPADHKLLLALADIAARYGMPIELHMEAVPRDMAFPSAARPGPPNPPRLTANIAAFERLLDHNTLARIVWLHAGWDLTGERSVTLMRTLLARHKNLYMSIKSDNAGALATSPFLADAMLKPEWVEMLRAFPSRFVIGSDQFFDQEPQRIRRARRFVDALPPDLARLVASENIRQIYRLAP